MKEKKLSPQKRGKNRTSWSILRKEERKEQRRIVREFEKEINKILYLLNKMKSNTGNELHTTETRLIL